MKPQRTAKPETEHSISVKLATRFKVRQQTAVQWFRAGCPVNYEEAVEWKLQRQADATLTKEGKRPSRFENALEQAKECEEDVNWDGMSTNFRALCDIVAEFYLMGMTHRTIQSRIGVHPALIARIIANHPDTKDKESQVASNAWRDVRRLAVDAIRDKLNDPDQVDKMKAAELNFIAGTAQDKVRDSEGGSQLTINIEHKINGLSYEELINSIPKKLDDVDAEYTIDTPEGTSNGEQVPPANSRPALPSSLNKGPKKSDITEVNS